MRGLDLGILVVYFAVVLGIGVWFSRKQKSTEDYFLAGRSLPGWVVAFSIIGTMIGSTTFVGQPGGSFSDGLWQLPFFILLPITMLLVARYVVTLYRHHIRMSVYEYLERRFGYPARAYGALAFILSRVVDVASTLFFLAIAVAYLTNLEVGTVIVLVGVFTIIYTVIGGIAAVAWTDVLQGVLLITGGLVVFLVAWLGAEGTVGDSINTAWEGGRFNTGDWSFDLTRQNAWLLLVGGIIWAFQRYACDQHMVQRYLTARTDREARRATYIGGVACLPIWIMSLLIGVGIWAFYARSGTPLPPEVLADQNTIVPHFIQNECPRGMLGLIVAALAAAAMSSLAADMNSLATVVVDDFYAKVLPQSSDRGRLWVGRAVVALAGIAAVVFALQWQGVESAMEFAVKMLLIATAGVLGLFALGLLTRLATNAGAWIGIVACVLFTAWATLTGVTLPSMQAPVLDLGVLNYGLDGSLIGILSHVIVFVVGLLASLFIGRRRTDLDSLTIHASGNSNS